jgi:gluconokinase
MIVILMGVSGCGKTTVGKRLGTLLHWPFYDGDDFHPKANVEKMARGRALTDADRQPWLEALREKIDALIEREQHAVLTCSALKAAYREHLASGHTEVHFVYLHGTYDLIQERLQARQGHFMPADLLANQFDTLEAPEDALRVDISAPPKVLVQQIARGLGLRNGAPHPNESP